MKLSLILLGIVLGVALAQTRISGPTQVNPPVIAPVLVGIPCASLPSPSAVIKLADGSCVPVVPINDTSPDHSLDMITIGTNLADNSLVIWFRSNGILYGTGLGS